MNFIFYHKYKGLIWMELSSRVISTCDTYGKISSYGKIASLILVCLKKKINQHFHLKFFAIFLDHLKVIFSKAKILVGSLQKHENKI